MGLISIRLPDDVVKRIQELADDEMNHKASIIRRFIAEGLKKTESEEQWRT